MKMKIDGDLLFSIGIIVLTFGTLIICIILDVIGTPLEIPWLFLPFLSIGGGMFLIWWGVKISNSPKTKSSARVSPAKFSKPRNPWIKAPKIEKAEKKDKKIPEIWEQVSVGE